MGRFTGGADDDSYIGTIDADQATGGSGNDILVGLGGNDTLDGEAGDDALQGGDNDDVLIGGAGGDNLSGGAGSDRIFSHLLAAGDPFATVSLDILVEPDNLAGGAGDDYLYAGYGDTVDGGANEYNGDTLYISFLGSPAGVVFDFRDLAGDGSINIGGGTITGVESIGFLEGSQFDDNLVTTGASSNVFGPVYGRGGNDTITVGYYSGTVYGGDGNDVLDLRNSGYSPAAWGEAGDDTIIGGSGYELLEGGDGNDTISGNYGYDTLRGGNGDDVLDGGSFGDNLYGGAGNDTMYGGGDEDQIEGGEGNDILYGDQSPSGGSGNALSSASNNDVLSGGAGDDTIHGEIGNDRIDGGADADTLYGEEGDDSLAGGDGDDVIDGGTGDDTAYGGAGDDFIRATAGADQLSGEGGDDQLYFGAAFGAGDVAIGGDGKDQLLLQGDYSAGVAISAANVVALESLVLLSSADARYGGQAGGGNFSYAVALDDRLLAAGVGFAIDAGGLGTTERLMLDATAETDARLSVTGGAGDDDLTGGGGADTFFLQKGGKDRAVGGGGNDGFFFGGAFTAADIVDGGAGTDTVALQGNYAAGATLTGVSNVEFLSLLSGSNIQFGEPGSARYSYSLTTTDANVQAGATLTVQATGLLAAENLIFNGSAETNGNFRIFAGQGNDMLTGGAGSDGFFFGADGNLAGADRIDGGAGTDSVALRGNYAVTLQDATFANIEVLTFLSGHTNEYGGAIVAGGYDYDVTLADGNLAAGKSLDVVGSNLRADESLRFDGRAETDGSLRIFGGAGDDILYGGSQADTLFGGLGKDRLEGGGGADTYVYQSAAQSTSTGYDQIVGFDWHVDRIDAPGAAARSFAQSTQGTLSTASFDADLTARMAAVLGANQAALFTANAGTLSGHVFAVIDVNGQAGYQAGQDLVIELINPVLPIDPAAPVII